MPRLDLRNTVGLLCAGLCMATAHGQGNKAPWYGTWVSGDSRVQISAQGIKPGADWCKWMASKPAKPVGCAAFDDLPAAKDQLVRLLDDAEVALKEQSAKKTPKPALSAEAVQQRRSELQLARNTLKSVSNGEFGTVGIASTSGGDCATYFFLDRATLYQVTDCTSQPQAANLRAFKKAP
jgi:hypothetical protein